MCMACPSERVSQYARTSENSPEMMIVPREYMNQQGYRQTA